MCYDLKQVLPFQCHYLTLTFSTHPQLFNKGTGILQPIIGSKIGIPSSHLISFNILVKTIRNLSQEEVSKIPKEWMNEAITCIKYEFHRCSHCKITHKTQICAEARQPGRYQHCPSFASPAWWLPVGWSGSGLVWTLHHSAVVHRLHLVRLCPYQRSHLPPHAHAITVQSDQTDADASYW